MDIPKVSVVIFLTDFYHLVNLTINSILKQTHNIYEIIIITNTESKKDLVMLKPYYAKIYKMETCFEKNRAFLMNKAISIARGEYIHFLTSGDVYLSKFMMKYLDDIIIKNKTADLLSLAFLRRDDLEPPEAMCFSFEYFKRGKIPMHMQSMWFNTSTIKALNNFNEKYLVKSDFDMVCKIFLKKDKKVIFSNRVLCDFEIKKRTSKIFLLKAYENLKIIYNNFGLKKTIYWWMIHDHFRMIRLFTRSLKSYFWGP
ncbi:MAG: Spore coat polysaccharide biosynthesis protein SpsA [Candidatus Anoxychlamydiales bacterium]|nr:Spore coat polysaccharide biosynthesis protein SpsA [Candidatus Anoxychlamydiales bacterium]